MGYIIQWLASLAEKLPSDNFVASIEALKLSADVLGYFNYFIPVSRLRVITYVWVSLIISYRFFILGKSTVVSIGKLLLNFDLKDVFNLFG